MKTKQNAIDLTDLAIGILILGITVGIGARLLITLRDNRLTDLSLDTTGNETINVSTTGSDTFDNTWFNGVTTCINSTNGITILPGNYTTSVDAVSGVGTITNATTDTAVNSGWNCTYTHYDTTEAQWSLPNDAASGIAEYGNWFDIIVIVGIAGVILSLIFLAFGNRGEGQSSATY